MNPFIKIDLVQKICSGDVGAGNNEQEGSDHKPNGCGYERG